jgi:hypothetical protein
MSGICRTAGREAGGGQGRSRRSRAACHRPRDPCRPPGASGTCSRHDVVDLHGPMLAGRRANGALKIRSEPALVAAAPEVGSILGVQDTLSVGKLVQVEVAAEVQLEEGRCRVSKGDVPGLGSDAGEGLGGQLHVRDDRGPVRDRGPNDRLLSVGVQCVLPEVLAPRRSAGCCSVSRGSEWLMQLHSSGASLCCNDVTTASCKRRFSYSTVVGDWPAPCVDASDEPMIDCCRCAKVTTR